jgi:molybdate transport system substrate-binding protein
MADQIILLSAGAVSPGLVKVIEAYRRETGHDVKVDFATAPELRKRLVSGESPDVVIAPEDLLDDLIKGGRATAPCVSVGRIGIGVMVRQGAPLPKIAGIAEFTQSLLSAESIVYNQASTGVYLESLFERLGITEDVKTKTTRYPDFAAVRDHVINGNGAEIGFGATTVIIENAAKGIHYVGPLPEAVQNFTTYAAALTANAGAAGHELLRYLAAPAAKSILAAAGIK